jgi:hypothetical protein
MEVMFWQVALFAAAPVVSVDEYFSTLEEQVNICVSCLLEHWCSFDASQVIAEFPATFRGHDTIFRIYGHRFFKIAPIHCKPQAKRSLQCRLEVAWVQRSEAKKHLVH